MNRSKSVVAVALGIFVVASVAACGGIEKAEWIKEADKICVEYQKKAEAIKEPTITSPDQFKTVLADALQKRADILKEESKKLGEIGDIKDSKANDDKNAILKELNKQINTLQAVIDLAKKGDIEGTQKKSSEIDAATLNNKAKSFGLKECGKG